MTRALLNARDVGDTGTMTTYTPVPLPEAARALLDAPEFATVATHEPDGSIQLSVVWIARDGDDVIFSTIRGRRKTNNLIANPDTTVLVYPADAPYNYLEVRGDAQLIDDPDGSLIQTLSQKYLGQPYTNDKPDFERVIVRIAPRRTYWHA